MPFPTPADKPNRPHTSATPLYPLLDAQDQLDRVIAILNYLLQQTVRGDRHEGESWILGDIEESLRNIKQLLNEADRAARLAGGAA